MTEIKSKNYIKNTGVYRHKLNFMSRNKGQASIEFVLVIPILIIVIIIVSQLGFLVYLQNVMEQAAREGARVLSTTNSNSLACEQIINICSNLEKEKLTVEIIPQSQDSREVGDIAVVNLKYLYSGFANFIRLIMGREILIKSDCTMRMECGQ
ncbi:MAG: hypothetical protein FJW69_00705 [Actinobacteria bacterium]|nr:hypothetical protein [Actinomycetota bacterium]MBM3711969.1 hypothetical protein [Actinomycetota bacterium]